MGVLTKAMTRLRDEIVTSRRSRLAFRNDLARLTAERHVEVNALCTAFARDRAAAQRAWSGLTPAGREAAGPKPEGSKPAPAPHKPHFKGSKKH